MTHVIYEIIWSEKRLKRFSPFFKKRLIPDCFIGDTKLTRQDPRSNNNTSECWSYGFYPI